MQRIRDYCWLSLGLWGYREGRRLNWTDECGPAPWIAFVHDVLEKGKVKHRKFSNDLLLTQSQLKDKVNFLQYIWFLICMMKKKVFISVSDEADEARVLYPHNQFVARDKKVLREFRI